MGIAAASPNIRTRIRAPQAAIGASVPLPTPITGMLGRWDAYSGITADTTNGGFKWAPETGSSVLQSATATANTGPDYSATALNGRPAMVLSTNKSLRASPDYSLVSPAFYVVMVLQMAAPSVQTYIFGGTAAGVGLSVNPDGSMGIERNNAAAIASAPAGTIPFGVPVLFIYEYSNSPTVKHIIRINKTAKVLTNDTISGQYTASTNNITIGRRQAPSAASDFNGLISYVEIGTTFPQGTAITDPEAALYQRWVA